ncbi:hypothetical protein [Geodermatophilus sp. URMC 63]
MSRVSPLRLVLSTGIAVGTAAAGLALAPAALATGLAAPTAPTTVAPGQTFTVSGTGCVTDDPEHPEYEALVVVVTDLADLDAEPPTGLFPADPSDAGAWSTQVSFPAGTTGAHQLHAACAPSYAGAPLEYPSLTVTVATAATPTATPTATSTSSAPSSASSAAPTTAATGAIRGTSANTPGVASPDSGAATGDTAAPGRKVVKVLTGFKPGEVVTVTLHSTPQTVATATADANGRVTVEFTVPAGTPTGDHTLVYEGSMGTYFQEAFAVTAASAASAASPSLAYTGASVALPLGLGAGALALGGGLVVVARRRSAAAAEAAQA